VVARRCRRPDGAEGGAAAGGAARPCLRASLCRSRWKRARSVGRRGRAAPPAPSPTAAE